MSRWHHRARRCRSLQGHCDSPIAGHARLEGDGRLSLRGLVFTRDGARVVQAEGRAGAGAGVELGVRVAEELLRRGLGS
ncbi:hypothetical protein ACQP1W_47735 [Spirillospora sp. CA-255316]